MVQRRITSASDEGLRFPTPKLLFGLLGAPVIWGLHLLACYFLVTLDCITAWSGGVWSVLAVTAVAAAGSGGAGWFAWSSWRRIGGEEFRPEEREWRRFLMLGGMAASLLFTATIVATGVVPLFVDTCA